MGAECSTLKEHSYQSLRTIIYFNGLPAGDELSVWLVVLTRGNGTSYFSFNNFQHDESLKGMPVDEQLAAVFAPDAIPSMTLIFRNPGVMGGNSKGRRIYFTQAEVVTLLRILEVPQPVLPSAVEKGYAREISQSAMEDEMEREVRQRAGRNSENTSSAHSNSPSGNSSVGGNLQQPR